VQATPASFDEIFRLYGVRILDAIFDGILVIDTKTTVIYVNPEYLRIVQIKAEDILGKPLRSVRPGALLPDVMATGRPVEGAYRREGSIEYIVDMSPIFSDGQIVGGISVVKDITEVKRMSEELERIQRSNKRIRSSIRRINAARYTFKDIIYESACMEQLVKMAKSIAASGADVLITGESGTGKEVLAQAIHNASSRSRGPFLALNCATLAPNVIESELFGYADGAFTGAKRGGKAGFFEVAEGGTLFLDEVTELPINAQAKFLRVLQERAVRRVGETSEIPMDVRVITASNSNIDELVAKGLFRHDLYYRFNTLHLELPPLRERGRDVLAIAMFFFRRFAVLSPDKGSFSTNVTAAFLQYPWPGNVREVSNIVEYAVHMGAKEYLESRHLPEHVFVRGTTGLKAAGYFPESLPWQFSGPDSSELADSLSLNQVVMYAEHEAIAAKIRKYGTSLAAKKTIAGELGVSLTTLYTKISKYGI
jgi:PAS domain S-box-containing protein